MKKIKLITSSVLPTAALIIVSTLTGCNSDNNAADLAKAVDIESQSAQGTIITTVTINDGHKRLNVGETHQLSAVGLDSNNDTRDITNELSWSSSDTSIATVNNKGLVTAIANSAANQGIITITGTTINGVFAETEMSVSNVGITSISLKQTSPETGNIDTCLDATIKGDVTYEDGYISYSTIKDMIFSVDENSTAKIDAKGNLYTSAAAIENTLVTAKIADVTGQLTVTADPKNLGELNILLEDEKTAMITLNVGDRIQVNGQATSNSDKEFIINNTIHWSQENAGVTGITATGENKGTLLALKPGVTELIGSCGGKEATAAVIVKGDADIDSIEINDGSDIINLAPFESVELKLTANYKTTPASLNVSEFSQWSINSNLLKGELMALGTDEASYKVTSTSGITGTVVVFVTYGDITNSVVINIE
ncbi:Ig-like domain-containing protein [Thalassotalea piscium]